MPILIPGSGCEGTYALLVAELPPLMSGIYSRHLNTQGESDRIVWRNLTILSRLNKCCLSVHVRVGGQEGVHSF
jgi:hypothetical protein